MNCREPCVPRCCRTGVALRTSTTAGLLVVAGLLWGLPCPGGSAAAAEEPSQSPGADLATPACLQYLEAESTNVAVLFDPLPWIEAVLESQPLKRVLTSSNLEKILRSGKARPEDLDTAKLLRSIRANKKYIPVEVAVATGDAGLKPLDHLVRAALLIGLSSGAVTAGEEVIQKDLPKLHDLLIAELETLRFPRITAYARFRSAETAADLHRKVGLLAFGLKETLKAKLIPGKEAISLQVEVSDLLDEEVCVAALSGLGILADPEGPAATKIAGLVRRLHLELWLELVQDGLRLTLGTRPRQDAPSLDAVKLGSAFIPGRGAVFSGRWDIGSLKPAAKGWKALLGEWADTEAGRAAARADTEDLLGDLRRGADQVLRWSGRGSLRIWVEPRTLLGEVRMEEVPPAASLAASGLLKLVPPESRTVYLDGVDSLADYLCDALGQFEERIATKGLQWEIQGDAEKAGLAEQVSRAYYGDLGEFRKLVYEKSKEVFEAPFAMVVGSGGKVENLELRYRASGKPSQLQAKDLPVLELAVIARVRKGAAAREHVAALYNSLACGVLRAAGAKAEGADTGLKTKDLGLSVPTWAFEDAWIRSLSGDGSLDLRVQGDLVPHFFELGDFLVMTTSARLSQRILSRSRDAASELFRIPAPAGDHVAFASLDGGTLAAGLEYLSRWVQALAPLPLIARDQEAASQEQNLIDFIQFLSDITGILGGCEWRLWDSGGARHGRLAIGFK
jgi:hypothetical protein